MKKVKTVLIFLVMLVSCVSPTFLYWEPEMRDLLLRKPEYWIVSILMAVGMTIVFKKIVRHSK